MVSASPEAQLQLLQVQAHESKVRHLARERAEAAADPELVQSAAAVAAAQEVVGEAQRVLDEAEALVASLEEQGAAVAKHIVKDEAALIAGNAGAGTLQGLQREIENLTAKASELEDAEIEALDASEEAGKALQASQAQLAEREAEALAVRERVGAVVAELDAASEAAKGERAAAASLVEAELLAVYEATLARRGAGAARLFHGTSEGSGLALAPGDLAEIRKSAADAVVFCPDSGVILVRHPDWM